MLVGMSGASAQTYPTKTIRFISPFPPGGGTDLIARMLAQNLSDNLGQQVIVDNRGGAQGNIANALAAAAPADGYTLILSSTPTFTINPWIYKVSYDPIADFAHISLATLQPYVVVVNPKLSAVNLKQLAAIARAKPDTLTFGSSSAGGQLAGEFFKIISETKMIHVPYKGAGPATTDLLGGQIDLMFSSPTGSIPHVKAGKLRALAVTAPLRIAALPDVPSSRESGFPELEMNTWYGVAAPARTPQSTIVKLNSEIARILSNSSLKERLATGGLDARSNTPAEMTALVKTDYDRWGKVVKASGMKAE